MAPAKPYGSFVYGADNHMLTVYKGPPLTIGVKWKHGGTLPTSVRAKTFAAGTTTFDDPEMGSVQDWYDLSREGMTACFWSNIVKLLPSVGGFDSSNKFTLAVAYKISGTWAIDYSQPYAVKSSTDGLTVAQVASIPCP